MALLIRVMKTPASQALPGLSFISRIGRESVVGGPAASDRCGAIEISQCFASVSHMLSRHPFHFDGAYFLDQNLQEVWSHFALCPEDEK